MTDALRVVEGEVRELIRRMDGRIWVESEEGSGSVFTFELPEASA